MQLLVILFFISALGCNQTVVIGGEPQATDDSKNGAQPGPPSDPPASPTGCTYFVSANINESGSGDSWSNASNNLPLLLEQASIALTEGSCSQIEIRLAQGVYTPSVDDRTQSFVLTGGITLRGGYQGSTDDTDNRDINQYETILSGDLGSTEQIDDNSYHVIRLENGGDKETRIDGLTLRAGNANGTETNSTGAGIYALNSKLRLVDVTVLNNRSSSSGAGIYISNGVLALERVNFTANLSQGNGGGVFASNTYITFFGGQWVGNVALKGGSIYTTECPTVSIEGASFISNQAQEGGALFDNRSQLALLNRLTFVANQAASHGGGASFIATSNLTLGNSQFVENVSSDGSAIYWNNTQNGKLINSTITANNPESQGPALSLAESTTLVLKNSIVWNNGEEFKVDSGNLVDKVDASRCIFSNGPTGDNISDSDPQFIKSPNAGVFDLALQINSPAIDSGSSEDIPSELLSSDCAARSRIVGSSIDIGAFEYQD